MVVVVVVVSGGSTCCVLREVVVIDRPWSRARVRARARAWECGKWDVGLMNGRVPRM